MASPGREKLDLVGGLADLMGTKPGLEVERLVLVVRLGAVVVIGAGGECLVVAAAKVGCVDDRDFMVVNVEVRG